jgi:hypothetical protein
MLPSKTLSGLKNVERVQKLKELGIDMDSPTMDPLMKNGTYIKKEMYTPNTDDTVKFRRRAAVFTLPNIRCDAKHLDILLSKHVTAVMMQ